MGISLIVCGITCFTSILICFICMDCIDKTIKHVFGAFAIVLSFWLVADGLYAITDKHQKEYIHKHNCIEIPVSMSHLNSDKRIYQCDNNKVVIK